MHHFETECCTRAHFCYKMVHCGIWDWYIVGFVQEVYKQSALWDMGLVHCGICAKGFYTESPHNGLGTSCTPTHPHLQPAYSAHI